MSSDIMEWQIPQDERSYLRELAQRQAEYACLPIMAERRQMWHDLNDGHSAARPPVIIETWTFERDFLPENVYRCTSRLGKEIEYQLLRNLRNHELMDDDKVMPDTFDILSNSSSATCIRSMATWVMPAAPWKSRAAKLTGVTSQEVRI